MFNCQGYGVTLHPGCYITSRDNFNQPLPAMNLLPMIRFSVIDISDGQVDIATRLAAEGLVEVTIADNGPGIDQAVAGSLFKPYQTSREDGMGLGLSISRSIIEAHNGKLWADEQRKKGALFCMSIPVID